MSDTGLSSCYMIGFISISGQGLALPVYAASQNSNAYYCATVDEPGDANSRICGFEILDEDVIEHIDQSSVRLVSIGDAWLDIFIWQDEYFIGTRAEIWEKIREKSADIMTLAPLSLLAVSDAVGGGVAERVPDAAFSWMASKFGPIKAKHWRENIYIRGHFLRIIKKYSTNMNERNKFENFLSEISCSEKNDRIDLKIPPELLDKVKFLEKAVSDLSIFLSKKFVFLAIDFSIIKPKYSEDDVFIEYHRSQASIRSEVSIQGGRVSLADSFEFKLGKIVSDGARSIVRKPVGSEGAHILEPLKQEKDFRLRQSGPFAVLDIGTSKFACMIGSVEADHSLRVLGFGWQRGSGVHAGVIVDIDKAKRVIRACVGQAEVRLREVTVNVSCGQPASRVVRGLLQAEGRAVTDADIRKILIDAEKRSASSGRAIIHAQTIGFSVDDAKGVDNPRGLYFKNLVGNVNIIDAGTNALRSLDACLARCDLEIAEFVATPIASAMFTVDNAERRLGTVLIDMGGGTTGLAVYEGGQLQHSAQCPVGGQNITNDIASVLSTPLNHAERLKTLYGSAVNTLDDERMMLPVPVVGDEKGNVGSVPRSMLNNIIRPRVEETFELVKVSLEASGLSHLGRQRVVLTGGASQLHGLGDVAERVLGGQVRFAKPPSLQGLPDRASGAEFATVIGMLAWSAGFGRPPFELDRFDRGRGRLMRRIINYIRGVPQ